MTIPPPKKVLAAMKRVSEWSVYNYETDRFVLRDDAPESIRRDEELVDAFMDETYCNERFFDQIQVEFVGKMKL